MYAYISYAHVVGFVSPAYRSANCLQEFCSSVFVLIQFSFVFFYAAVSPGPTPDSIGDVDHTIIGALLQAAQGDIDPLLRLLTHVNSLNWTLKARLQETERLLVLTEKTLKERVRAHARTPHCWFPCVHIGVPMYVQIGRLKHKLVAARSYSNTAPSEVSAYTCRCISNCQWAYMYLGPVWFACVREHVVCVCSMFVCVPDVTRLYVLCAVPWVECVGEEPDIP